MQRVLDSDVGLLLKFILKVILNKKSLIVYIFLILFYTISLLFSFYILEYKNKFVTKLKSVYPHVYIYSQRDIPPLDNTIIKKEIFEINFTELEYSYDNRNKFLFTNIALRSFDKFFIPSSIEKYKNDLLSDSPIIYVDNILYKKITSSANFKNGIYISYKNGEKSIFVQVKPIDIFDNVKWIVLSNNLAKSLFNNDYFDKNVIYGKNEQEIYKKYKSIYPNTYRWDDNLSFFSIVFYSLIKQFYLIFNFLFLVMILLFIYITLKGLLKELKTMILFASRYSMSMLKLFFVYLFGIVLYFDLIFVFSYIFANISVKYINNILDFSNMILFPSDMFIYLNIIIFVVTSLFIYYYGIYFQRVKNG